MKKKSSKENIKTINKAAFSYTNREVSDFFVYWTDLSTDYKKNMFRFSVYASY